MKLTYTLLGRGTIKRGLTGYSNDVRKALVKQSQRSAINIQRVAKQNLDTVVYLTPPTDYVRTGNLKANIRIRFLNNGLASEVYNSVFYAAFVEFGTGRRGAATNQIPLPQGYAHGTVAGMNARPYLYPAWETEHLVYLEAIAAIIKKGGS